MKLPRRGEARCTPPLQAWPRRARSSSAPTPSVFCAVSFPVPPSLRHRLVLIKAFRPPLSARPRGERVWGLPDRGWGLPAQSPRLGPPRSRRGVCWGVCGDVAAGRLRV